MKKKLESISSGKFAPLTGRELRAVKGGSAGWTRTGGGDSRYGSFVSDNEFRDDNGRLTCAELTFQDGSVKEVNLT